MSPAPPAWSKARRTAALLTQPRYQASCRTKYENRGGLNSNFAAVGCDISEAVAPRRHRRWRLVALFFAFRNAHKRMVSHRDSFPRPTLSQIAGGCGAPEDCGSRLSSKFSKVKRNANARWNPPPRRIICSFISIAGERQCLGNIRYHGVRCGIRIARISNCV